MKKLLSMLPILLALNAQAQIYRCGNSYSTSPCKDAKTVLSESEMSELNRATAPNRSVVAQPAAPVKPAKQSGESDQGSRVITIGDASEHAHCKPLRSLLNTADTRFNESKSISERSRLSDERRTLKEQLREYRCH